MDLTNWALRTSPKFTTGVKCEFYHGFWPGQRSGNPNHSSPPTFRLRINKPKFTFSLTSVTAPKSWAQKSVFQSETAFILDAIPAHINEEHTALYVVKDFTKTYYYARFVRRARNRQGGFSHLDSKNYPRHRTHGIRYISLFKTWTK